MALYEYRRKRNLQKTPEPGDLSQSKPDTRLRFVIQKHQASHLHYDLRLELDGVLKSWAVPKGIPSDPSQKRLAIMVEDHPFDYRNFEGVIPEGNYGAGTVMIWDEGWYSVPEINTKDETEKAVKNFLAKGHLVFFLHGHKIYGTFDLVKTRNLNQKNSWLLIKNQEGACQFNSTPNDKSVRTGRTMEEIKSTVIQGNFSNLLKPDLSNASQGIWPKTPVKPMMAQLIKEPFDRNGWIFEIKWDGYRAIAEVNNSIVKLYSRNGKMFNRDFPQVVDDLQLLGINGIIDGELVVVDQDGKADFNALQNYTRTQKGCIVFYVFDLLFFEQYDLRDLPLIKRKEILQAVIPDLPHIRFNNHVKRSGREFFRIARENNLEGIMAKDENSPYKEGERSWSWQKIKNNLQQEFVIGGYTKPKGARTGIGALLVGVYNNKHLYFSGGVGSGFSEDDLTNIYARLLPLKRESSPFETFPMDSAFVTWVEPTLVCEVRFAEWTVEGFLRQPVFLGFRDDIEPEMVQRETAISETHIQPNFGRTDKKEKLFHYNGKTLKLTNLNKIFWSEEGITKEALIEYYHRIAPRILPYLKDRPQSLHRFPDGIDGKHFFHKDITDAPDWTETVTLQSESQQGSIKYLLCQDEATLMYIVNLGAIEINVWNSCVQNLEKPDYMVIDLDPLNCPFQYVVKTALYVHKLFEKVGIPHYVKTSGATGLHIFSPMNGRYTYDQVRQFSLIICTIINKQLPDITSIQRMPYSRVGKVYLDFLQNTYGKTMVSAYSLRPRRGAPVSTPLFWEELTEKLDPHDFNIETIFSRLELYDDLWKPVLGEGVDMSLILPDLQKIFAEIR